MPLDRVGGVTGNGGMGVHCPGAYAHVLAKVCEEEVYDPGGGWSRATMRRGSPYLRRSRRRGWPS